ncbi:biopolymer transporter ExbD [Verrucomicrobiaceae bacterium N1E253]|uniref:Biopolymer transporter ExbD n=1 Tax=Oceaniferula marina TaxID=2748318 RepID=A0A851GEZ7_9BACT|nr:biopolymer transporter ExbD [Oceaniferula marina]NWK56328.1 biopolymer transporter ExbD [Oceaniferula marina]
MKFQTRQPEKADFPLAPMVDVVFLLLIFFIATMQYSQSERELNVSVPVAEEGADARQTVGEIIVNVRENGEVVIDKMVMNKAQLFDKLQRIAAVHKNQAIRIRGDGKVEYQKIVEVIDVCQKAGIPNISFATQVQRKKP